jgi:hypothetical protein
MACVWRSRISLGRDDFSLALFNDRHGAHLASAALRPRSFAASMPLVERGYSQSRSFLSSGLSQSLAVCRVVPDRAGDKGSHVPIFVRRERAGRGGEQFFFEVRFGLLKASVTRAGRLRLRDAGNVDQITVKRRKQS